ncbi:MAG: haloacid dehalogenase-like hydrolase, partial [Clostridiales bacterium]|nr:haloacid dehalogenase-like hydrolase [Clostridiales bacterium]
NYVNVYDFDNTIYDGETLVDFIIYYIKRDPAIWKYIPKLLIIAIKDALHLFTVPEAVKAYASFLEGYYIHLDDIEKAVVDFWNKNEKKIKPWYAEVRQASDIVVSGSTDFILDEIMKRMGIENYVGSSIDKKSGKFTRLCFLDNKVKIFKELYHDKRIKNFYTDSMNDKPMMDISENVYLVKKNKITKIK